MCLGGKPRTGMERLSRIPSGIPRAVRAPCPRLRGEYFGQKKPKEMTPAPKLIGGRPRRTASP
jgi:hypothetical protein